MDCDIPAGALVCAGLFLFFDNGKTVLLGKEYRERYDTYAWMEFGGKQEPGQTLAETGHREGIEETASTLYIPLAQVQEAERQGHYVDHYNEKTKVFYRMYCLVMSGEKPDPHTFEDNAKRLDCKDVEKVEWGYFNTSDVVNNIDGVLPGTDAKLYPTLLTRLEKLRNKEFLKTLMG